MNDEQDRSRGPITANREDGSGRVPKPTRPARSGSGFNVKQLLQGGTVNLMLWVVVLILMAMLWRQAGEVSSLRQQFDELSSLIQSTDESLSQSGTALSLKIREQGDTLDKHWSEIKKLWGVSYDRNRKAIEANTKLAEEASTAVTGLKKSISRLDAQLATVKDELQQTSTTAKNLGSSALATSVQLEELQAQVAELDDLSAKLKSVSTRVAGTEAALKALDTYRLQVNQQLNQLRKQVQGP